MKFQFCISMAWLHYSLKPHTWNDNFNAFERAMYGR